MSDYVPKPDIEGINSNIDQNRLKDAAILLAGFLAVVSTSYFLLVGLSDWALSKISVDQEVRWLGHFWSAISNNTQRPEEFELFIAKLNQHLSFKLNVGVL